MWLSNICGDTSTRLHHTEKDVTSTLIIVPIQDYKCKKKRNNYHQIYFFIQRELCICVDKSPVILFILCATFLTHRQTSIIANIDANALFINLSSYGNYQLFTHTCKLF